MGARPKPRPVYWVDLPDPDAQSGAEEYICAGTFNRLQDALDYLKETWGMQPKIARYFVTKGME